jgi:hypothetical protein
MDLLTTCTHDLELQVITAPPLISAIHKSLQHPLSIFQPAMSSTAVPWQRLLTLDILQLPRSSLVLLPYRTALVDSVLLKVNPGHGPRRNTPLPTVPILLSVDSLLWDEKDPGISSSTPYNRLAF